VRLAVAFGWRRNFKAFQTGLSRIAEISYGVYNTRGKDRRFGSHFGLSREIPRNYFGKPGKPLQMWISKPIAKRTEPGGL
jgi:hypothetical protein